jgi:L-lactate dehydrogenase
MKNAGLNGRVVVIGAGNVGATIAYTILMNDLTSEIVMIDVNKEKAQGEVLDMNHGLAYFKQVAIREGDYEDCADADVIIITAGVGRKPGQTRLELAQINTKIIRDITKNIMKYAKNPMIVVVSNPVDVLTYIVQKESGLPANRVIGSGTSLDTSRFKFLLSKECNIDVRNIHAYIVGEHGDSEVALWSHANVAGKPFDEFCNSNKHAYGIDRKKIFEETKNSGAEIIRLKGATFYGIGMSVARIVGCILGNEHAVLTVSTALDGQYDLHDVALSLPVILGSNGVERYMDIYLSDEEYKELHDSADKLKESIKAVY